MQLFLTIINMNNRAGRGRCRCRCRCDGLLTNTIIDKNDLDYSYLLPLVMYECKNKAAISWWRLAKDQLWEQADSHKNDHNRLWVIGQIGFEVCVFRLDVVNYTDREMFKHFSHLYLNNYSTEDLDFLNIRYIDYTFDGKDYNSSYKMKTRRCSASYVYTCYVRLYI